MALEETQRVRGGSFMFHPAGTLPQATPEESGEEAVAMTRSALPDLVLMDISLPKLDGYEATRILRGFDATRNIPIIALTAHAMTSDREQAMAAGCTDFESKPVEFARLVGKIQSYLS